jgi:hypothetical protein
MPASRMRFPRFTTLQLLLITTLAALLAGLFTSAWPCGYLMIVDLAPGASDPVPSWRGDFVLKLGETTFVGAVPLSRRTVTALCFIGCFGTWGAAWGIARKRGRESLAKPVAPQTNDHSRQRLPTPSARPPLAMRLCWGLMIVGGLVALAIPIGMMFIVGPWLFPTLYFSLLVGVAAISRGAAADSIRLKRTAALQLANMIALDVVNVVFAAMEYALLRTESAQDYLREQQPVTVSPKTATRAAALSS